jgi:DivIVA domain-containing protein
MPVTPGDIRDHKFSIALGGYDRDAVDSFLAKVAESYQHTLDAARLAAVDEGSVPERFGPWLEAARKDANEIVRLAEEDAESVKQHAA